MYGTISNIITRIVEHEKPVKTTLIMKIRQIFQKNGQFLLKQENNQLGIDLIYMNHSIYSVKILNQ